MAFIGLRYPIFAPINTETPYSPIVYDPPVLLGAAIAANVSFEHADNPLYGNDAIAENDNGIIGGSVSFSADDIDDDQQVAVLGARVMGTPPDTYLEETGASARPGGFGYIRVKKKYGVLKFVAYWVHKTQFGLNEDNAETKGDSIEWQTPTIEGTIMGVFLDPADDQPRFRRHKTLTTFAAAQAWVDEIAGVNATAVATPTATPASGEVSAETTVALATETSGATIYYTLDGSTPTTGSMVYSTPITIYGPVTIKAIAVKTAMANSAVLTAPYTIEE